MQQSRKKHTLRNVLVALTAIILAGTGYLGFAPSGMIPLDKTTTVCRVMSGGTLRVHTTNCGTLLYRGKVELTAGIDYTVSHTGPIAWDFASTR